MKTKTKHKRNFLRGTIACVITCVIILSQFMIGASAAESGFDLSVVNFDAVMNEKNANGTNASKMNGYIQTALNEGAEIILFPEYSLTGVVIDNAVDVEKDTAVSAISKTADEKDVYILFGALTKDAEAVYSSLIICTPEGTTDVYNKTHLTDSEWKAGLKTGISPYVLQTPYGKFGLALGDEFAKVAEMGKYYYGSACRMILVAQSYSYDSAKTNSLSQARYDVYTSAYAYHRMYSRSIALANLFANSDEGEYFGESFIFNGSFIGGGNESKTAPAPTANSGVVTAQIAESSRDTTDGMASRRLNLLADWYGELTDYTQPVYGQGSKYKDDVRVASVNFHAVWGDVETNVTKMKAIMEQAHNEGVELLVFPEMALTAYSVVQPKDYTEEQKALYGDKYMQHVLAPVVRGENPSEVITDLQALAASYGMYVLVGLPEKDELDPDVYWNSVAILGPNTIKSYRKVNLAFPEHNWSDFGKDNDGVFETPFGLVGIAICADIYNYQELQRTYSEMGCRIVINCTAGAANNTTVENGGWQLTYQNRLESFMLRDGNFMMTSNLVGYEGPELTGELKQKLADAGYTQDDITSSWLYKNNSDLYNLLYKTGEDGKAVSQLNSRACVFPGSSLNMALNPNDPSGVTAYGNTADSAELISYGNDLGPYLDKDNDGKSPYISYTTDTFDKYYTADFDLSYANLSPFRNENPFDYQPELYFQWYSEMFYKNSGINLSDKTLSDKTSGISVSGLLADGTTLAVSPASAPSDAKDGFDLINSYGYNISLVSLQTTPVWKSNIENNTASLVTVNYEGEYAPNIGMIKVSIPIDSDADAVYANGELAKVVDGKIEVSMLNGAEIAIAEYKAKTNPPTEPGTNEPANNEPTDTPKTNPTDDADKNTSNKNSDNNKSLNTGELSINIGLILLLLGASALVGSKIVTSKKRYKKQ
ncbi:MAG: carbon-nitrogen hydrolase family protein [Oscillospiraceae bacterium]|nr:carbon-nitrogen hydrolase family protein [Oscillospiraceae bacterium]